MKYQKIRIAVIALCVLAAGICYALSRNHEDRTEGSDLAETFISREISGTEGSRDSGSGGRTGPDPSGPSEGEVLPDGTEGAKDEAAPSCYVHICGEVVSPGVYELQEGSRIFQAVEKAGGFTENAAGEFLNMAEQVKDGMKIVVLNKEEAEAAKAGAALPLSAGGPSETQKSRVNLNTATKEELMTLRGIGEARAEDILRYRENQGGFHKIEDIMKVSGIKDAAFQKIKEDITV
ncbi:helix-hairpin-helix domain-containing protein [Lachnospiraceae bacterium 54-53]